MKKTETITENRIFTRLYVKGKSAVYGTIVLYYRPNGSSVNRLGLTSTKKIGCAVKRNRARRVIREAYRLTEDRLRTGYDMVIVARSRAVVVPMSVVRNDLEKAFAAGGLLFSPAPEKQSGTDSAGI